MSLYSLECGLKTGGEHIYSLLGLNKEMCKGGKSQISTELEKKINEYMGRLQVNNPMFLDYPDRLDI